MSQVALLDTAKKLLSEMKNNPQEITQTMAQNLGILNLLLQIFIISRNQRVIK